MALLLAMMMWLKQAVGSTTPSCAAMSPYSSRNWLSTGADAGSHSALAKDSWRLPTHGTGKPVDLIRFRIVTTC